MLRRLSLLLAAALFPAFWVLTIASWHGTSVHIGTGNATFDHRHTLGTAFIVLTCSVPAFLAGLTLGHNHRQP